MHVAANVPNGRVEDLVEVLAPVSPAVQPLRRVLVGSARGAMTLEGPAETMEGRFDLDLSGVSLSGRRLGDGALHARLDRGNAIALDSLALARAPGRPRRPTGGGTSTARSRRDSGWTGSSSRSWWGRSWRRSLRARGTLTLAGTVGGTDEVPDVALTRGRTPEFTSPAGRSAPMALEARVVGEQLELKGRPVADTDLRLTARIKRPYPYEATLKLALGDLRALLPDTAAAQGLNGSASGRPDRERHPHRAGVLPRAAAPRQRSGCSEASSAPRATARGTCASAADG